MNDKKQQSEDGLTRFVTMLFVLLWNMVWLFLKMLFQKKIWTKSFMLFWSGYFFVIINIIYSHWFNVPNILQLFSFKSQIGIANWVYTNISREVQFAILFGLPLYVYFAIRFVVDKVRLAKYQTAVDHLGLKTSTGLKPMVTDVVQISDNQSRILVTSVGIDIADLKAKKGSLESGLNAIVQDIRSSPNNRQVFEILNSKKDLPKIIQYEEVEQELTKPYSFIVGLSVNGIVTESLPSIHHLLIAGSTGNGKSFFFKLAILCLLKSSKYLQLYLLDLKRGVDMRVFLDLKNVRIAKEGGSALEYLRLVNKEMERRFEYLEKNEHTEVDPKRDNLDRIVVAIDEASLLFTVEKSSKVTQAAALEARDLTDRLAKLGRAAGIHLILATQKVVKETIDTRVQTNIHAKLCFRVGTVASSMTVLGNKKAAELPETPGRAIWSVGSRDIEVQVPLLTTDDLKHEVIELVRRQRDDATVTMQPMLKSNLEVKRKDVPFNRKSAEFDGDEEGATK